jgi:hypothetical protein
MYTLRLGPSTSIIRMSCSRTFSCSWIHSCIWYADSVGFIGPKTQTIAFWRSPMLCPSLVTGWPTWPLMFATQKKNNRKKPYVNTQHYFRPSAVASSRTTLHHSSKQDSATSGCGKQPPFPNIHPWKQSKQATNLGKLMTCNSYFNFQLSECYCRH